MTTLAGSRRGYANGLGTAALFNYPRGVALDAAGAVALVVRGSVRGSPSHTAVPHSLPPPLLLQADTENHVIRRVDVASGLVTTLAGKLAAISTDGVGTAASFYHPSGIAMDAAGAVAFVVRR